MLTRRSVIAAGLAGAAGCAVVVDGAIEVHRLRQVGETDDTAAARRALASGRAVHFVGGQGSQSDGAYRLDQIELPAGAHLFGDGPDRTILRAVPGDTGAEWGMLSVTAPDHLATVDGIRIESLTLADSVVDRGFLEHRHLMRFRGVGGLVVRDVRFYGFRGDGLCLAGEVRWPQAPDDFRHNRGVMIEDCWFDGVNGNNRNGVSVIDCVGLTIRRCRFARISKPGGTGPLDPFNPRTGPGMPGAIDLEPNAYPHYRLRDVLVDGCSFDAIGGSGSTGVVSVVLPATLAEQPGGFTFRNNRVTGKRGGGYDYYFFRPGDWTRSPHDHRLLVAGHVGERGFGPFMVDNLDGVTFARDCRWSDYTGTALIGYEQEGRRPRHVSVSGSLTRCATGANNGHGAAAITVFAVDDLAITDARFLDCGNGENAISGAILFLNGESHRVTLRRNRCRDQTGRTRSFVAVSNHRFAGGGNVAADNDVGGLPSAFPVAGGACERDLYDRP